MSLPERARSILDFWFGELDGAGMPDSEHVQHWFTADRDFDARLRARFGADLERSDQLAEWERGPEGALALVVLTDQFPRNIHRGTAKAFAFDPCARAVMRRAIDAAYDHRLLPIQRAFLYMPLQHAEELALQDEAVQRLQALVDEAPARLRERIASFASHAENHRAVIAQFGRFPHRNRVLGRTNTSAEQAWLERNRHGWGQGAGV